MGSIPRKSLHLPPAARAITGTPSLAHGRTPSGPVPALFCLVKVTILLSLQHANHALPAGSPMVSPKNIRPTKQLQNP